MAEKMLSPEEVAERLAVTPNTVRTWLRNGTLKGIKLGKKIWRVKESELQEYLCREQSIEYGVDDYETKLSAEDLKAVRRGLIDIQEGRIVTLGEYEQGKRP